MNNKIVLSGTSSSGKTSLLQELKKMEIFSKSIFIEEVVRSLIKQGIKINKEADHFSQLAILEAHYKNTLKCDNFITDRGAIDAYVYATDGYLRGKFSFKEHKEHEKIFISCLNRYDYFFYLPIEFPLVGDGVRDEDTIYREETERLFLLTYDKYNIPFIILSGSINERISILMQNLF